MDAKPAHLPKPSPPRPTINAGALMQGWELKTKTDWIQRLAVQLGVDTKSLFALGAAWAAPHKAWAFPMVNGSGKVCGIRLRAENGSKWSVTGGLEGVFAPSGLDGAKTLFLPEGPTNTAAMVTLGVMAIGRPSCSGGVAHIDATIARLKIQRAVIIADSDKDRVRPTGQKWNPGADGALALANSLKIPTCIIMLPCKDARDFVCAGGTKEMLDSIVAQQIWRNP